MTGSRYDPYWPPGHEKAATSPAREVIVHGVLILSRYHKQLEFVLMAKVIAALHSNEAAAIKEIECDSKYGSTYSVTIRRGCEKIARSISARLHDLFMKFNGGHNGIFVEKDSPSLLASERYIAIIDADWGDEDLDLDTPPDQRA